MRKSSIASRLVRIALAFLAITTFPILAAAQFYTYGLADLTAGNQPAGVISADFNHDGRPDLAVSNFQDSTVSILFGSANGGFTLGGTYPTGSSPAAIALGDFNGDKILDIAVVDENESAISILLGNKDGSFQEHVDYPAGGYPVALVIADFNSDGKLDIAVLSEQDSAVSLLLGNGNGTFEVQALIPVTGTPAQMVGGDVNGDGKIDLILTSDAIVTALVSQGDGSFQQKQSQGAGSTAMAVGDFNGDGKLDVAVSGNPTLSISFGNGDGTFQNPSPVTNAPQLADVQGLLVGDFNLDGKTDIALAGIWVMLGKGNGSFRDPIDCAAGLQTTTMTLADVNLDGKPDIVAVANFGPPRVLIGEGNGNFASVATLSLAPSQYNPTVGVSADFNGDGKVDLAVAEINHPNGVVSVELGNGNGTFKKPIASNLAATSTNPSVLVAGDFNGDHKPDLLVEDDNNAGFQVLLGNGDGTFATPVDTQVSVGPLAVGDFNGDGKTDVAASYNNITIYLSNGDGTFTQGAQYPGYSGYLTAADVNGDGIPDLIVTNVFSNVEVFLGNGNGTFGGPISGPSDFYTSPAAAGDFNGDGKIDIAVAVNNGIAFLAGNGDGTFQNAIYSDQNVQLGGPVYVGDFNGDGKLDLTNNSVGFWFGGVLPGKGDGTFLPPIDYGFSGAGGSMIPGDFNADGVLDFGISGQLFSSNTPVVFLYLSAPVPNVFPAALNFGSEKVGKGSGPKKVHLANPGNARLKISKISVTGDFSEQNNCGKNLHIGKGCTIQVLFKPTQKGRRQGVLTIADNGPGGSQVVKLQGTGN